MLYFEIKVGSYHIRADILQIPIYLKTKPLLIICSIWSYQHRILLLIEELLKNNSLKKLQ